MSNFEIISGVREFQLTQVKDPRGTLIVAEFGKQIPFEVKRTFFICNVPSEEMRGEHAHIECHQFLVCVRGHCTLIADNGDSSIEVNLSSPLIGIHMSPMIWGIQCKYSPDAVLAVFASHYYDPGDYIRDYNQFLGMRKLRPI